MPGQRISSMSIMEKSEGRFFLYCHPDGTCSLKRDGDDDPPRNCASLIEAVQLAHDLKGGSRMHMTVYDPAGKVLLQSFA
jgi:hypothetical protein